MPVKPYFRGACSRDSLVSTLPGIRKASSHIAHGRDGRERRGVAAGNMIHGPLTREGETVQELCGIAEGTSRPWTCEPLARRLPIELDRLSIFRKLVITLFLE